MIAPPASVRSPRPALRQGCLVACLLVLPVTAAAAQAGAPRIVLAYASGSGSAVLEFRAASAATGAASGFDLSAGALLASQAGTSFRYAAVELPAGSAAAAAGERMCDPRSFGARGDGATKDTAALQRAIDSCAGGGTVILKAGTFLSAPLELKSGLTLRLEEDAVLLGSPDPADYNTRDGRPRPLLGGGNLRGVTLSGKGAIDGNGAGWWARQRAAKAGGQPDIPRPRLVEVADCSALRVENITLRNSAMFHLVTRRCEDVLIEGIRILAPADSPNTDGIDPISSHRVTISRCFIDTGDDNIAIKSGAAGPRGALPGVKDIVIRDCEFRAGHGVSIGSETSAGVANVLVERCSFHGTDNGIRIKSSRERGGEVRDIEYRDITMIGVKSAIVLTGYYPKIPDRDPAQTVTSTTPWYHDLRISRLQATGSKNAGFIVGVPERPLTGIRLEDVSIEAVRGLTVRHAGVQASTLKVKASQGAPVIVQEGARVEPGSTGARKP